VNDRDCCRRHLQTLINMGCPSAVVVTWIYVPFWQQPPRQFAPVIDALVELEHRTREAGGLVLRMGHLYGPGTIYAPDGYFIDQVRARASAAGRRRKIVLLLHRRGGRGDRDAGSLESGGRRSPQHCR
jgi:hypothetical protein